MGTSATVVLTPDAFLRSLRLGMALERSQKILVQNDVLPFQRHQDSSRDGREGRLYDFQATVGGSGEYVGQVFPNVGCVCHAADERDRRRSGREATSNKA